MPGQAPSGERPAKRSRVSRACDQCRTAREKCDGTQPTCQTCSTSKRTCTYTSAPKKRGIQPGYIRTLELALTWLFQNTDSEALLNKKIAQEGISSVLFGRETKESNRLHKSWRRSKFCKDVDKLLSGEQPGGDHTPKSDDDDDSDAEADVAAGQNQRVPSQANETISPTQFLSPEFPRPTLRPNLRASQPTEVVRSIVSHSQTPTPLPAHSWRLLDIYFAYTQSWLPICEKHDVLRISYSYPEQGMVLSELPDSGDHAELWSILAVATQEARNDQQDTDDTLSGEQLYGIARDLIPNELSLFSVGHVKALLNLAVINIGKDKLEAAWLLVGSASRILNVVEHSSPTPMPRIKQLFAGCFLLDGFLSLQLGRTHLQRSDIQNIEEDGLEEWQPWADPLHSAPPSRTPVMGLSSFNRLLDLTDILLSLNAHRSAAIQQPSRLDYWKAALPAKFDHIIDERRQTPLNPPALLLQATYLCTYFSERPSQAPVQRFVELLEQYHEQLGFSALPPPIHCQLNHIQNHSTSVALDERLRSRLERISDEITRAWSSRRAPTLARAHAPQGRPSFGAYQVPTPESIQIPFNPPPFPPLPNRPQAPSHRQRQSAALIDELLPDMNPTTNSDQPAGSLSTDTNVPANFNVSPLEEEFRRPSIQNRQSVSSAMVPPDLENFFDELASLDGAEKLDNRPQFMENLGFAPDANMADFLAAEFGQFIPGNAGAFIPHHDDPTHLDPAFFGAA